MKTRFPLLRSAQVFYRIFGAFFLAMCLLVATLPALAVGPAARFSGTTATVGSGFILPQGVAVDASGNVYVSEVSNQKIKEIPRSCIEGANNASCITMLGGGLIRPYGVAVDASGNVYVADSGNSAVKEVPSGCASSSCVTTLGGGFDKPNGVAVDRSGNVFVADYRNSVVKKMPAGCASSDCVLTVGGKLSYPNSVAVDGSGHIYTADILNNAVTDMEWASVNFGSKPVGTGVQRTLTFTFTTGGTIGAPLARTVGAGIWTSP